MPLLGLMLGSAMAAAIAPAVATEPEAELPFLRPSMTCPTEVPTLMTGLLRDLPAYANRVARRSIDKQADGTGFGTMLVAGRAEFEPLDIDLLVFDEALLSEAVVQQVFFTTLERQYITTEAVLLEQYHWLFLTAGTEGWHVALMFSRLAPDESERQPPTPPMESSDGIVGQAVRLWLRDCRAGAVYPIEPGASEAGAAMGR